MEMDGIFIQNELVAAIVDIDGEICDEDQGNSKKDQPLGKHRHTDVPIGMLVQEIFHPIVHPAEINAAREIKTTKPEESQPPAMAKEKIKESLFASLMLDIKIDHHMNIVPLNRSKVKSFKFIKNRLTLVEDLSE